MHTAFKLFVSLSLCHPFTHLIVSKAAKQQLAQFAIVISALCSFNFKLLHLVIHAALSLCWWYTAGESTFSAFNKDALLGHFYCQL